jgi:hypothetical protein
VSAAVGILFDLDFVEEGLALHRPGLADDAEEVGQGDGGDR